VFFRVQLATIDTIKSFLGANMRLIIWGALVALGIYIGITYQDDIMDALNMREMESVQDKLEDANSSLKDSLTDLSDKASEKAKELQSN
ncbi:MAG: hypothetical protein ACPHV3_01545, partial [Vibrio sp.]